MCSSLEYHTESSEYGLEKNRARSSSTILSRDDDSTTGTANKKPKVVRDSDISPTDQQMAPTTPARPVKAPSVTVSEVASHQAVGGKGSTVVQPLASLLPPAPPVALKPPDIPFKIVSLSDVNVLQSNKRYAKVPAFRANFRIVEISKDNPCTVHDPKPNEVHNQKMIVAGVQADGSIVLLQQWIPMTAYEEAIRLQTSDNNQFSKNDRVVLNNNLNFLCTPTASSDVLLSVVVGTRPPGKPGVKILPPAIVVNLDGYDLRMFPHAICKIMIPVVARSCTLAMQLTPNVVQLYKDKYGGEDPTKWYPVQPNIQPKDESQENEDTEESFFGYGKSLKHVVPYLSHSLERLVGAGYSRMPLLE